MHALVSLAPIACANVRVSAWLCAHTVSPCTRRDLWSRSRATDRERAHDARKLFICKTDCSTGGSTFYDLTIVSYTIAAFYRFVALPQPEALRDELRTVFADGDLRGTMLIAEEGVNGTMAGSSATIEHLLHLLAEKVGMDRSEVKFSYADECPFKRLKLRVKAEIITFRNAKVDPNQPGQYVPPAQWNALIADQEVLLLDTRNHDETEIGTFAGAVVPGTETFSDFVTYVREHLDPDTHRKVAMFCTGGIRCEKASAFLLQEGFQNVYHLQGGILKYLEEVPEQESQWHGACYVFDRRTSVEHADFKEASD